MGVNDIKTKDNYPDDFRQAVSNVFGGFPGKQTNNPGDVILSIVFDTIENKSRKGELDRALTILGGISKKTAQVNFLIMLGEWVRDMNTPNKNIRLSRDEQIIWHYLVDQKLKDANALISKISKDALGKFE